MNGLKIDKLRNGIDRIDREILDLLNKRAEIALEIGELKREDGIPTADRTRELEIIARLTDMNKGPMPDKAIGSVFTEIISACRALQSPVKVCFLGPEATFSHAAAMEGFGRSAKFIPLESISDVFREVESGRADYGVVPVENSTEGTVGLTLDHFINTTLNICGEVCLGISHALLSNSEEASAIERIYSHPQALAQCRDWIKKTLPAAEVMAAPSTAAAAVQAVKDSKSAAIGAEMLAEKHGLKVLARDIQDRPLNLTRFLVLGREECPNTGSDKTSIWFVAHHQPGSLFECLKHFADQNINMTRIESRPSNQGPWEYVFFLDFEGHILDEPVRTALERLSASVERVRIMGSYPMAAGAGRLGMLSDVLKTAGL